MKMYTITKVPRYIVHWADGWGEDEGRIEGEFNSYVKAIEAIKNQTPTIEVVRIQDADNSR